MFIAFYSHVSVAEDLIISIRDDVYNDYLKFVNNRNIEDITDFRGKTVRRDVIDMLITQQALKLGGFEPTLKYVSGKLNFRNTKRLQKGGLLISLDSYWLADAQEISDDVYISAPVIRKGEYVAGLYTSPDNSAVLAIKTLDDLKNFTAVSTRKWKTDWKTLSQLPLKELIEENEWLSMARMVSMGWIDILFMPLHANENIGFIKGVIKLIPVKNVAIVLNDSRHLIVSKKHPRGAEAFNALEIGLKKLREQKLISKAYKQAGFFIDQSKVTILNKSLIEN